MEFMDTDETVIDFDPELNEINFRRYELARLSKWLEDATDVNGDIKAKMIENVNREYNYLTVELVKEWHQAQEDSANDGSIEFVVTNENPQ